MKETNNLELVQRVKDGMQRCLATAMSRRGLDEVLPSYGDVLCLLRLMGTPVPVSDLVTTLRRPKSTITKATDFLAREGLLRKRPNPGDGRSILVELTESVGEMMFQGVTSQARKEFFDMLEKVDANLYGHHC
jgi:DNA-binding MarR family transcriptional regulator